MILRCPSCGREGNVADRLGESAHKVRCRRCGTRFSTVTLRVEEEPRVIEPTRQHAAVAPGVLDRALASLQGFPDGSDEITAVAPLTPFDSQYEMTVVLGGDPDDSQTELPAFDGGMDESGEIEAGRPFETASSEFAVPVPWYFSVIDSWGRLHFYVATGFAASSLLVLGFLLVRALVAGYIVSSSVIALIIGCVGTIAFLLISLSATVLTVLLFDLARNVRALIQQSDRNFAGSIDAKHQDNTRFSHPV
jgi:hypothetical protein